MVNKIVLLLIGLFLAVSTFAQPGEVPTEMKNGKKYHVHEVMKGQTAYGISRLYQVSLNELFEQNPEAEEGLNIGQKLYFLVKGEVIQQENTVSDSVKNAIIHIVEEGETLYSIARKYGVPASDVINANTSTNLPIGAKVIVPLANVKKDDVVDPIVKDPINPTANPGDSIIIHRVKKGETLYSLSKLYNVSIEEITEANDGLKEGLNKGMKLRIPLKKSVVSHPIAINNDSTDVELDSNMLANSNVKEVYDVAVMIPFFFEENEMRMKKCPPIGDCPIYEHTLRALDFHHGIMMAIDSLKRAGLNVNVHVYDTKNDTAIVNDILGKVGFSKTDLIIGPFYTNQIKVVRNYSLENHIQMICPLPVSNKALFQNPYVTKMIASTPTQLAYMAKEVARKYHDQNIILVRNQKNEKDEYYYKTFKKAYLEEVKKYPNRTSDSIKETYVNSKGSRLSTVESKMLLDKNNVIIVPSQSVGHVTNFFTKLSSTANANPYRQYPVTVFGLEDWNEFPTLDEKYKNKFNLNMVTSGYINYNDSSVVSFIQKYRNEYQTDPSDFSFIGFDAAFVNIKGLFLYGTGYANYYQHLNNEGYFVNSKFKKVDAQSGFENKNVFMLRYEDFSVVKE